jgi:hypothetical protein
MRWSFSLEGEVGVDWFGLGEVWEKFDESGEVNEAVLNGVYVISNDFCLSEMVIIFEKVSKLV